MKLGIHQIIITVAWYLIDFSRPWRWEIMEVRQMFSVDPAGWIVWYQSAMTPRDAFL